MRETEADGNGGCGGFDAGAAGGSNGGSRSRLNISVLLSDARARFINPPKTRRRIKLGASAIFRRQL